jgi:hypothetical protein
MIVRKLLVSDGRTEREVLLVGTIVVGRDPSCQLNDLDPLLSRRHAEFVPTGKGVTVRDLKSRNGILVNGDKVPEHALKPGDVVQLGHLHVRYVEERVVKSPEDHSRVRAKTETGIEVPTMAPPPKANPAPSMAAMAADAPTAAAPAIKLSDDTDLDLTVAPAARRAAPAPAREDELILPDIEELGLDTTVASASRRGVPSHSASPAARHDEDADATRVPSSPRGTAVADDRDATVATSGLSLDETRVPAGKPHATAASTEARLVANMSLVVTEASPSCQTVIGARPDTIVGGQLSDAIARGLRFVATGDGPPALSLSIARASSGNTITVTFKTGQATERHS